MSGKVSKIANDQLVGSVELSGFRVNSLIAEYLESLTKTGLYGHTVKDVARFLLYEAIRRKVNEGEVIRIDHASRHLPGQDEATN